MNRYLDLDLLFRRTDTGYRAQVVSSPAGQANSDFIAPFSDLELENLLLRIGRPRRSTRRLGASEMAAVKTFGGRLFSAVFTGDVLACFRMSVEQASAQDAGLRIRLRISEVPELADLPWEYLYNAPLNRFLSLSAETPVVRYLDLPERVQPLRVELPIRVLVMVASPSDYPPLNVEAEWTRLKDALKDLEADGRVVLERLPNATLQALQRRLRRESCHVFHFIGHGGFSEQHADGLLVLEDNAGRADPVSSQYLGALLHDHRPLRVAVLNACEGARGGRTDPFAGTAQSLVQQGIPAVIAMQFEITDEAAVIFAHELYLSIADGCAIDTALAEARKALFSQVSEPEWGTPVLYMRASDGHIFDVTRAQKQELAPLKAPDREAQHAVPNSGAPSPSSKAPLASPRVYISYSWDSAAHKQRVLELSNALRGDGIESHLDQYEVGPPSWKQWQRQQISAGDFVLMVCTEEYRRRVENQPGRGAHTDGELIRERLAADPDHGWLVALGFGIYRENRAAIPAFVGDADYYNVAHHDGYQRLLARLLGQPLVAAPPVSSRHARASGGQAAPEIGTVLEEAKRQTNFESENPSPPTLSKLAILNDEIRKAEQAPSSKPNETLSRTKRRGASILVATCVFLLVVGAAIAWALIGFKNSTGPSVTGSARITDALGDRASPVVDRRPSATAPAQSPKSTTASQEFSVSTFAGEWEQSTTTGLRHLTAVQVGKTVRFTSTKDYAGTYLIGNDGRAIQRSFILQDAQGNIRTTEKESEADQISTIVATVNGDVLTIEVTLDVRRPIGDKQVDIYRGRAEFKRL